MLVDFIIGPREVRTLLYFTDSRHLVLLIYEYSMHHVHRFEITSEADRYLSHPTRAGNYHTTAVKTSLYKSYSEGLSAPNHTIAWDLSKLLKLPSNCAQTTTMNLLSRQKEQQ